MNFGKGIMINSIEILAAMGKAVQAVGVKPEIEAFDTGHVGSPITSSTKKFWSMTGLYTNYVWVYLGARMQPLKACLR